MQRYFKIRFTFLTIPSRNMKEKSQGEYHSDTINIGDSFAGQLEL